MPSAQREERPANPRAVRSQREESSQPRLSRAGSLSEQGTAEPPLPRSLGSEGSGGPGQTAAPADSRFTRNPENVMVGRPDQHENRGPKERSSFSVTEPEPAQVPACPPRSRRPARRGHVGWSACREHSLSAPADVTTAQFPPPGPTPGCAWSPPACQHGPDPGLHTRPHARNGSRDDDGQACPTWRRPKGA